MDLNADCGESLIGWVGDDAGLDILAAVSSANVATGFHAGDPTVARRTIDAAAERGVAVGAHVSYDDLRGFGRRFVDVDPGELRDLVVYQIGALHSLAAAAGTRVRYVKPHGALYNAIVHHEPQARAVAAALDDARRTPGLADLSLLTLPGSAAGRFAEELGIRAVREAFADRAYRPDGTLVPRGESGAVITGPDAVAARVAQLAATGRITAADGTDIEIDAESVCVHGDTPGAVELALQVRRALEAQGAGVAPFA